MSAKLLILRYLSCLGLLVISVCELIHMRMYTPVNKVPQETVLSAGINSKRVSLWVPPLPYPPWSTIEERTYLEQSIVRWQHSVGMCAACFAYHHRRVISPCATLCAPTAEGKNPEVIILVSTIHKHRLYRNLICQTWGSPTHNNTGRARLPFLFGKEPGGNLSNEQLLQKEAAALGDILQDDFNSTYRRGGEVQLIMGYRWVVEHCPNVSQVLKVSDDIFVNIPKVLELISAGYLNNTVWGLEQKGSKPVRNKGHRYYISPQLWPAAVYPNYCAGPFFGASLTVIRKILLISPFISWSAGADDVIVGMCVEKLGIPTKHVTGFTSGIWTDLPKIPQPMYAVHLHSSPPDMFIKFWRNRADFES